MLQSQSSLIFNWKRSADSGEHHDDVSLTSLSPSLLSGCLWSLPSLYSSLPSPFKTAFLFGRYSCHSWCNSSLSLSPFWLILDAWCFSCLWCHTFTLFHSLVLFPSCCLWPSHSFISPFLPPPPSMASRRGRCCCLWIHNEFREKFSFLLHPLLFNPSLFLVSCTAANHGSNNSAGLIDYRFGKRNFCPESNKEELPFPFSLIVGCCFECDIVRLNGFGEEGSMNKMQ